MAYEEIVTINNSVLVNKIPVSDGNNSYAWGELMGGLLPRIVVTAPTGSTVVATKGAKSYTVTEVSGTWTIEVDELGAWTVTGTLGSDTASETVNVEKVGVYSCNISYYTYNRVGGRIFYDNGDNGATYTFFDADKNIITDTSISGLITAYYYDVKGTSSADRFYVYDNTSHTYSGVSITSGLSAKSLKWGYYGTFTGVTSNTIGSGKTNTQIVLNMGVPTDKTPNIWGYIKDCRDNSLNGCNDWFIASKAEQDQLRNSGLINWYSSNFIWSSVDYNSNCACDWTYNSSTWIDAGKGNDLCAFAARSF